MEGVEGCRKPGLEEAAGREKEGPGSATSTGRAGWGAGQEKVGLTTSCMEEASVQHLKGFSSSVASNAFRSPRGVLGRVQTPNNCFFSTTFPVATLGKKQTSLPHPITVLFTDLNLHDKHWSV